jgi:hypothetical protein
VTDRGRRVLDDLREVVPPWITARLLVLAGFVVAYAVADTLVPDARPAQLDEGLLSWDGTFYRDIADHGYEGLLDAPVRFFPLYPLLGRYLGVVLGRVDVALILVSNLAALVLAVLTRRLVLHEQGRDREAMALADRAVWLMMLVPPAFVLVFGYAEALLLAAAVGLFLALRREQWWWAAGLGVVAALTRPIGLFLVLPALIEVGRGLRDAPRSSWPGRAAAVAGPPLGTAIYLLWAERVVGDWQAPFRAQEGFRGDLVDPVTRLVRGVQDLTGSETFGDGLHLPFAVVIIVLTALTFRYWPASYGAYAAAVVLVSLSADNLNSLERYGLNAFPIILTLAVLVARPRAERVALALCGGGLVAFTALALLGALVP